MKLTRIMLVGLLLTACGGNANTERTPPRPTPVVSPPISYDVVGLSYSVLEFRLTDGTRCLVVPSTGVTCDWKVVAKHD